MDSPTSQYGFFWPDREIEFFRTYNSTNVGKSQTQRELWQKSIQKSNGSLPQRSDSVKDLIRKGIPREYRSQSWLYYSGAYDSINHNQEVYSVLFKMEPEKPTLELFDIIERDLPRTFPDNIYFKLNRTDSSEDTRTEGESRQQQKTVESLIPSLRRVLQAFAIARKEVGYCQGLNFIVGSFLLFMGEEEAFWLLVNLTDTILPIENYTSSMMGICVDQEVLNSLLHQYCPVLAKHLDKVGFNVSLISSKWFITLYLNVLPFEVCMRIWDCLFYEGSKVLFRVAIAIFLVLQKELLTKTDTVEIFEFVKNSCLNMYDCETLLHVAFYSIRSFPKKLIEKKRKKSRSLFLNKQNGDE